MLGVPAVEVAIGDLAAKALAANSDPADRRLSLLLPRAVRFYLNEKSGEGAGWRYPSFLPEDGVVKEVTVPLEEGLWGELQAEAERQAVGAEALLQHAAFYYIAARDDGRLTEWILGELVKEESPEGAG
jgi:hypothetical protein